MELISSDVYKWHLTVKNCSHIHFNYCDIDTVTIWLTRLTWDMAVKLFIGFKVL